MSVTRLGTYKKKGNYVEVAVDSDSCYDAVAAVGAEALGLETPTTDDEDCQLQNGPLSLFRTDGTIICDEPIQSRLGSRRWSIGLYSSHFKKTPAQLRLGVGYLSIVILFFCNLKRGI